VDPRQRFAKNLRSARQRRGLSQEALGHEIGLHRTEVSLLERAQRDPRLETIVKLAQGLRVSPADLLAGIE
jgi:transcriptional regulator with XRE-family HTH domain